MDPARRTAFGVGAFAALEAALAAYVLAAVGSVRIGLFVTACAVATAGLAVALERLLRPASPPPGEGGTGPMPEPPPEPSWWPDFERELDAYSQSRRRRDPASTR
ncbi:hypothetical protein HJD18_05950 [Thermoleophilia bacterium SCSIO 60948]|nr:hypothetical protein HJD18_05950 [Thermoleophilia bacterium SCSIO 60948]